MTDMAAIETKLKAVRDAFALVKTREQAIAQQVKAQDQFDKETIETLTAQRDALQKLIDDGSPVTPEQLQTIADEIDALATEVGTPWDTTIPAAPTLPTV